MDTMTGLHEHPAPHGSRDTDWQCSVCKRWHPVTALARDCERKHNST